MDSLQRAQSPLRSPSQASEPSATEPQRLEIESLTAESFAPYGQVVEPQPDGVLFGVPDAQLDLAAGQPRFYLMRLQQRGLRFDRITRHQRCTQCLGALGGQSWLLAVAPPSVGAQPEMALLKAFEIPGDRFIKLHLGTWHAGPYFEAEQVDFYNLELSDTNEVDHETFCFEEHGPLVFGRVVAGPDPGARV